MKTLPTTIGLASALALAALAPVEAQQTRDDRRVEREESRGSALARFAARALGADEEEAEAAALLLPAVQAVAPRGRPEADAEPMPSEEVSLNYEEVDASAAAANACPSNAHCDWINLNAPEGAAARKAETAARAGSPKMQRASASRVETAQSGEDETEDSYGGGARVGVGDVSGDGVPNAGLENDEIDSRFDGRPEPLAGIEPDEIDARATDAEAGLILPAVQKVREAASRPDSSRR